MKKVQKMQKKMEEVQTALGEEVLSLSVGGGAIKVEITGQSELKKIDIDPALLKEDKEMIEETLVSGIQEALDAAAKLKSERLEGVSEGINIPGLM